MPIKNNLHLRSKKALNMKVNKTTHQVKGHLKRVVYSNLKLKNQET